MKYIQLLSGVLVLHLSHISCRPLIQTHLQNNLDGNNLDVNLKGIILILRETTQSPIIVRDRRAIISEEPVSSTTVSGNSDSTTLGTTVHVSEQTSSGGEGSSTSSNGSEGTTTTWQGSEETSCYRQSSETTTSSGHETSGSTPSTHILLPL